MRSTRLSSLIVAGATLVACGPERAVVRWEDATETIRPEDGPADDPGFGGVGHEQHVASEREQQQLKAQQAEREQRQRDQQQREQQRKADAEAADAAKAAVVEAQKLEAKKKADAEAAAKAAVVEAQKLEAKRKADAEAAAKAAVVEAQKLEAKRKADADAAAAAKAAVVEAQQLEAKKKADAEAAAVVEAQKRDAQKREAQKQADALVEAQRLEAQRLEAQRLEAQKLAAQKLAAQKLAAQKLAEAEAAKQAALVEEHKRAQQLLESNKKAQTDTAAATRTSPPALTVDDNVVCLVAAEALTAPADALARWQAAAQAQAVVPATTMAFVVVRSDPARSLHEPPPLLCRSTKRAVAVRSPLLARDNTSGAFVSLQTVDVVLAATRIRGTGGRELRVLVDDRGEMVDVAVLR